MEVLSVLINLFWGVDTGPLSSVISPQKDSHEYT